MLHYCNVKIIMIVRGFVRTPFVTIFNKITIHGKRTRTPPIQSAHLTVIFMLAS